MDPSQIEGVLAAWQGTYQTEPYKAEYFRKREYDSIQKQERIRKLKEEMEIRNFDMEVIRERSTSTEP